MTLRVLAGIILCAVCLTIAIAVCIHQIKKGN